VIMVGEIRDLETAEISIQAALTGHLRLHLHTNDAPAAVTRLQDMGCESYLLSSVLTACSPSDSCVASARPGRAPDHGRPGRAARPRCDRRHGSSSSVARAATSAGVRATVDARHLRGVQITDERAASSCERLPRGRFAATRWEHGMVTLREDAWAKACSGQRPCGDPSA